MRYICLTANANMNPSAANKKFRLAESPSGRVCLINNAVHEMVQDRSKIPLSSLSFFSLKRFSNCSKISVGKTLRFKAPVCFKERNSKVCGNSRVEDGEECDPGLLHLNDDPCCTSECKFKKRAQCR